jgi:hypothetical protein
VAAFVGEPALGIARKIDDFLTDLLDRVALGHWRLQEEILGPFLLWVILKATR